MKRHVAIPIVVLIKREVPEIELTTQAPYRSSHPCPSLKGLGYVGRYPLTVETFKGSLVKEVQQKLYRYRYKTVSGIFRITPLRRIDSLSS